MLSFQSGSSEAFHRGLLKESAQQRPVDAVHHALARLVSQFASHEFLAIDRLMRSTKVLRSRKSAVYERQEEALFSALCELWPEPRRRGALRLVAMASVGALRLAIEAWEADEARRPIVHYLNESFAELQAEI